MLAEILAVHVGTAHKLLQSDVSKIKISKQNMNFLRKIDGVLKLLQGECVSRYSWKRTFIET